MCRLRPRVVTSANPRYGNQIALSKQVTGFYPTANGVNLRFKNLI